MFKLRLRSFDTSKFFQSPHLVYHHPLLCSMAQFQNPGKNEEIFHSIILLFEIKFEINNRQNKLMRIRYERKATYSFGT